MPIEYFPALQILFTDLIKYNSNSDYTLEADFNYDFSRPDSYFIMIRTVCKTWKRCFDELIETALLQRNAGSGVVLKKLPRAKVERIFQRIFVVHLIDSIAVGKSDLLYNQLFEIKEAYVQGTGGMQNYSLSLVHGEQDCYRVPLNAVNWACESGRTDIAGILLKDPRVNPADYASVVLSRACGNDHRATVRVLLRDKRADPSAECNEALSRACYRGHNEIVKALIEDPRVDPSAFDGLALRQACYGGHTETVRILLEDGRVDPTVNESIAIEFAFRGKHIEILKLFIKHPLVDPSLRNNRALQFACEGGHHELVRLLLQDARVDAAQGDVIAVLRALADMLESEQALDVESAMKQFSKLPIKMRGRVYGKMYPFMQQPLQGYYPGCAQDAFHDRAGLSSTLQQKSQAIKTVLSEVIRKVISRS